MRYAVLIGSAAAALLAGVADAAAGSAYFVAPSELNEAQTPPIIATRDMPTVSYEAFTTMLGEKVGGAESRVSVGGRKSHDSIQLGGEQTPGKLVYVTVTGVSPEMEPLVLPNKRPHVAVSPLPSASELEESIAGLAGSASAVASDVAERIQRNRGSHLFEQLRNRVGSAIDGLHEEAHRDDGTVQRAMREMLGLFESAGCSDPNSSVCSVIVTTLQEIKSKFGQESREFASSLAGIQAGIKHVLSEQLRDKDDSESAVALLFTEDVSESLLLRRQEEAAAEEQPAEQQEAALDATPADEGAPAAQQEQPAPTETAKPEKLQASLLPLRGFTCFADQAACEKATNNCSEHGTCVEQKNKYGQAACFVCECGKFPVKKTDTYMTQWTGAACQTQDISLEFNLFFWTAIIGVFVIVAVVHALIDAGNEPTIALPVPISKNE